MYREERPVGNKFRLNSKAAATVVSQRFDSKTGIAGSDDMSTAHVEGSTLRWSQAFVESHELKVSVSEGQRFVGEHLDRILLSLS